MYICTFFFRERERQRERERGRMAASGGEGPFDLPEFGR